MSEHLTHHAVKGIAEGVRSLAPLPEEKNPFVAFLLGICLGALGVAIYFKSAKDFFICMGCFIALTMVMPFGLGEVIGWLFAPAYGAWRAHTSNENLRLGR
ncbi:MAG TPA: hypothetical protein VII56_12745 [Rhizomicrobium sp.]